jgi:hypothetical protein
MEISTRVFADWKDYRVGDALSSSTLQRLSTARTTSASPSVPRIPAGIG